MYLLHNELNFIVMNNKHCIFLSGVAALVTLPSFAQSKGASEKPMNILYIMSDDHSFQTISAYDHRFIETPNIDRIGNEGVVFTNSFVANSISGPSRACMLTGKHSHKNGFIVMRIGLTETNRPSLSCCRNGRLSDCYCW